ncbi:MAG TPA: hypothetical protein VJS16_01480, partial [Gammaproteobacteria bacterium]|nr:hypothetical protein [Gammaproteobacteria bacterium]
MTGASGRFGLPPEPSHHMRMGRPALSRSIAQFISAHARAVVEAAGSALRASLWRRLIERDPPEFLGILLPRTEVAYEQVDIVC